MVAPHSAAFRRHALQLARAGDRPISKVALDLGISETTLRKWIRRDDERTLLPDGVVHRREIDALARQVRNLEIEVDLLKRATAGPDPLRGRRTVY